MFWRANQIIYKIRVLECIFEFEKAFNERPRKRLFFDLHFWNFDIFSKSKNFQKYPFWQTFSLEMPFPPWCTWKYQNTSKGNLIYHYFQTNQENHQYWRPNKRCEIPSPLLLCRFLYYLYNHHQKDWGEIDLHIPSN